VPIHALPTRPVFPDPREAEPDGLLAVGGDLSAPRILAAYRNGIFPWYAPRTPILWWSPPERALILPGQEHLSRRTRRALRLGGFEVRKDTCFAAVINHCARIPRPDQDGTWITAAMRSAYIQLHQQGYAHSFETFRDGRLVGGLYGLSLGAAFFGESMFSLEDYGSRAAFAELCRTAWAWGFHFIDGQLPNPNLADLGAAVLDREEFLARLARALEEPTRLGLWTE
jgi:leucyl/phenylalanyl-tRNA--protein transferase